ncbi:hypothetical protein FF1_034532 [Malus domestica]
MEPTGCFYEKLSNVASAKVDQDLVGVVEGNDGVSGAEVVILVNPVVITKKGHSFQVKSESFVKPFDDGLELRHLIAQHDAVNHCLQIFPRLEYQIVHRVANRKNQ